MWRCVCGVPGRRRRREPSWFQRQRLPDAAPASVPVALSRRSDACGVARSKNRSSSTGKGSTRVEFFSAATSTTVLWCQRSNDNCRQTVVKAVPDDFRSSGETRKIPSQTSGAKGTRTPDPHTARCIGRVPRVLCRGPRHQHEPAGACDGLEGSGRSLPRARRGDQRSCWPRHYLGAAGRPAVRWCCHTTPRSDETRSCPCWCRGLLLTVGHHDGGVHVEHHHVTQIGVGDLRGWHPARQLRPDVAARPGTGLIDLGQPRRREFSQGAPHRRRGSHRTQQCALVTQHGDVAIASPPSASTTSTSVSTRPRQRQVGTFCSQFAVGVGTRNYETLYWEVPVERGTG